MKRINKIFLVLLVLIISFSASAQNKKPRISPPDTAIGMIGKANVVIAYSKPSVKDRKIWGELVKYDSVWRAGANEATTFATDKDLKIEGKVLPAGTYALFMVPKEKGKWVVIFNNVSKQWGAFKYDMSKDQLRVTVRPDVVADKTEVLEYAINPKGFSLAWENIIVPVHAAEK